MKPIVGATYRHHKGALYMCVGFCIREVDMVEQTRYASIKDGTEYCRPTAEFEEKFEALIPAPPSLGLPAVAYLWSNSEGMRISSIEPNEFLEKDYPGIKREALVRLEDAYAKWSLERVQHMALQLKDM